MTQRIVHTLEVIHIQQRHHHFHARAQGLLRGHESLRQACAVRGLREVISEQQLAGAGQFPLEPLHLTFKLEGLACATFKPAARLSDGARH